MRLKRSNIEVEYFHDENGIQYRRESSLDDTLADDNTKWYCTDNPSKSFRYVSDKQHHEELEKAFDKLTHEEWISERDD